MTGHTVRLHAPSATVVGESLVDIVHASGRAIETPGGSPLNVAVTLARLGVRTSLLTALGNDDRAEAIIEHLRASGVSLTPGARRLDRTSTATASLCADGSAVYDFDLVWDPPPSQPFDVDALHAGSIGLFLEPGATTVHDLLQSAAGRALITLDPNVRPSLLPDATRARETFQGLLGLATVVKLSDEDAAWLFPGASIPMVVQRLLSAGPSLVAVTRGAEGCVLACAEATVEMAAPRVAVADTIGAGDSFMGALIYQIISRGLSRDLIDGHSLWPEELTEIGAFASDVAAATVSRPGADPPWLHEVAGSLPPQSLSTVPTEG